MKRTELIELAKEVDFAGRRMTAFRFEKEGNACQKAAALLLQIAEAMPVAARYGWDGDGWLYIDNGSGSDWLTRHADAEPLYTLPLED